MAKGTTKVTSAAPPDSLTMRLFAPGMSPLHRAGLGGLACTLKAMERHHAAGLLRTEKLPAPFVNGRPPWEIDDQTVKLKFGGPEDAGCYLRKLFKFAFQIRQGVIFLPGQYPDPPPPLAVRAAIQDGIQNTFLQHGPTCGSRDGERTVSINFDETIVSFTHDVFTSYKHQGWFWLERDEKSKEKDPETGKKFKTGRRVRNYQSFPAVSAEESLSCSLHGIDNKLSPGGIVRHDSFSNASAVRETDAGLICLHFAIVGCLTLSVNPVTAILLIPEASDLLAFTDQRRWLTPQTFQECRIAGAADAALQAQVRVRTRQLLLEGDVPSCSVMTCRPTKWNEKQKTRVATAFVASGADPVLDQFERALSWLPPRLRRTAGAVKWTDSAARPLIAENLAKGHPWYRGFAQLFRSSPSEVQLDRKGLQAMTADDHMWDTERDRVVVRAVHAALRERFRDIARIYQDRPDLMPRKFASEAERWGRAFSGAMTADHFRKQLCELFRRGGQNPVLQEKWHELLPMLHPGVWGLTRDLALIAICSYQTERDPETTPTEDHEFQETDS